MILEGTGLMNGPVASCFETRLDEISFRISDQSRLLAEREGDFGQKLSFCEIFGETVSLTSAGRRALLDRRRSSSGTGILKTEKGLAFPCFRNGM